MEASFSSSKGFSSRAWNASWEGCWWEGRKSLSVSFSYSSSVSFSDWTKSFIRFLCRVGCWSSSQWHDSDEQRLYLATAERVFEDWGFDELRVVRFTPPESSSCALGFFDLWERLVGACENMVEHSLIQRIGAAKL